MKFDFTIVEQVNSIRTNPFYVPEQFLKCLFILQRVNRDLVQREAGGAWVCVHKHMHMVLMGWGFDSSGLYL